MLQYGDLPHLNALLNGLSALLLAAGYARIRSADRRLHRNFMIAAFVTSVLFLTSYLIYHAHAGSVRYQGQGLTRLVYFIILVSHSVLATAVAPMVLVTFRYAWKGRFDRHRRLARWTLPVWLYVSITGVLVYLMLYH